MKLNINKKNYTTSINGLNKFISIYIYTNRKKIFQIFKNHIKFTSNTSILDVGTTESEDAHENYILKHYKYPSQITAFSNQDCSKLVKKFQINEYIKGDARKMNIKDFSYDIVHSTATLEHVGSFQNQVKFLSELCRVSKKYVFITTPNRFFPIEFHTRLPFLHFLPKKLFRKILKKINLSFFSYERNLNLLDTSDLINLCKKAKIKNFEIHYNKIFFLKANIILIVKKTSLQ